MKTIILITTLTLCSILSLKSQNNHTQASDAHQMPIGNIQIDSPGILAEAFELLDLNSKGLEKVKQFYDQSDYYSAAKELLNYYKNRTSVQNPEINLRNLSISKDEQKWADEGLTHHFFSHRGYQPSFFYGEDIDWEHWPIKDNELRWQLHRHKWWSPMGKSFRITGDEKYAQEWKAQYIDWIEKNPLIRRSDLNKNDISLDDQKRIENTRFAWRPLEVSHRLQDQINQFQYFIDSEHFTPEFLTIFLTNYHKHAQLIPENYSERGNHLLFEAQRLIYAGTFFPEYKDAHEWRESGIEVLNNEIKNQVFEDGFQYELDPRYHLASINIFLRALSMADANGFREEFPQSYLDTIEKMMMTVMDISFPDYTLPLFSDAKAVTKRQMLRNFRDWSKLFPENSYLKYMATERENGEQPNYLSTRYKDAGFYIFRSGWDENATVMIVKAGPPAFWHNQPDNGTFELFIKGRNFFPDAGSYVYGGDAEVLKERDWFRQTKVHNTLTLNGENINETDSKCLLWDISDTSNQKFVTENQGYPGLKHRRALFYVDNAFFVIVDDAIGESLGDIAVNFHLSEGKMTVDKENLKLTSDYKDGNNIFLEAFGPQSIEMEEEESWVSYDYRQKSERTGISYNAKKTSNNNVSFITIVHPFTSKPPKVSAKYLNADNTTNGIDVEVKINNKTYNLNANW